MKILLKFAGVIATLGIMTTALAGCSLFGGSQSPKHPDSSDDKTNGVVQNPDENKHPNQQTPDINENQNDDNQNDKNDDDQKEEQTKPDDQKDPQPPVDPDENKDPVEPNPPVEPDPVDPPVEPDPQKPEKETLDFSAFEAKIKDEFKSRFRWKIDEIISYSISNNELLLLLDMNGNIKLYEATISPNKIESQTDIDLITANLTGQSFSKSPIVNMGKALNNFSLSNGLKYDASKGYIEGDNPFARCCGVENALRTYISDFNAVNIDHSFESGHGKSCEMIVIYQQDGNLMVKNYSFAVMEKFEYTDEQRYENWITPGKYREIVDWRKEFNLGKNLKENSQTSSILNEFGLSALEMQMVEDFRLAMKAGLKESKASDESEDEIEEEFVDVKPKLMED